MDLEAERQKMESRRRKRQRRQEERDWGQRSLLVSSTSSSASIGGGGDGGGDKKMSRLEELRAKRKEKEREKESERLVAEFLGARAKVNTVADSCISPRGSTAVHSSGPRVAGGREGNVGAGRSESERPKGDITDGFPGRTKGKRCGGKGASAPAPNTTTARTSSGRWTSQSKFGSSYGGSQSTTKQCRGHHRSGRSEINSDSNESDSDSERESNSNSRRGRIEKQKASTPPNRPGNRVTAGRSPAPPNKRREKWPSRAVLSQHSRLQCTPMRENETTEKEVTIQPPTQGLITRDPRYRRYMYDSSSSSDYDPVAHAIESERLKKELEAKEKKGAGGRVETGRVATGRRGSRPGDCASEKCQNTDDASTKSRRKYPSKKKQFSRSSDSSDPDIDANATCSEDFENKDAKRKRARNPIALMKKKEGGGKPPFKTQNVEHDANDILWSDISDEEAVRSADGGKSTKKKIGGRQKKTSGESTVAVQGEHSMRKERADLDRNQVLLRGCDDSVSECESNEVNQREDILKPQFLNPKLGVGKLEPLCLPLKRYFQSAPVAPDVIVRCQLEPDGGLSSHQVPPSINRYLQDYQRDGIKFMHELITTRKGCILGDDMGLGKTVQIIGLLAAIQKKAGTDKDLQKIKQNRIRIGQAIRDKDAQSEDALLLGTTRAGSVSSKLLRIEKEALTTGRIMIVVPPSVIANWQNELDEWGHFGVAVYQDKGRDTALDRVRIGIDEILICGKSLFSRKDSFEALNAIKWRLIVIDEFHEYKNKRARSYECVKQIRAASSCPIVGLTGTLMQNSYDELWALVSLVQPGLLGEFDEFQGGLAKPLMYARSKTATGGTLDVGEKRQQELTRVLKLVFLERKKEQVLKDTLTQKDEVVVFCEMTSIQKRIYLNVLELPDVRLLKEANAPCDCGVNQWFFIVYNKLKTKKERLEYARRNKEQLVGKKECCHQYPLTDLDPPTIHPDAILWKSIDRHSSDSTHSELCKQCPWCVLLPALNKLYKVCSHASLLQADQDPGQLVEGSAEWKKVTKTVDFAKIVLTPDILQDLPGQSYVRKDGIMNEHIELSGKMKYLDYLLDKYSKVRDRVLIFSYSTKTLDLIQHYVQSMGYSYLRLDGSTPNKKRQGLVDQFQNDPTIFLFLISTKAGGLGLNLTSANKVIVFDVNWNPSYDEQAQDRAFRIGQNRDVKVVRLVAQGTIEEHMYMRQLYKVHLKQQALGNKDETLQAARIFRGVVGDKNRKGELFGTENLLNYKDGSFMLDVWKSSGRTIASSGSGSPQMHCTEDVSNALNMLTELQLEDCFERHCDEDALLAQDGRDSTDTAVGKEGFHHQDFLRSDRGGAAIEEGDEGFEEEMGGASQMIHVEATRYCEAVDNCGKDGIDADDEAISMQEDQEEKMEKAPKVEDETLGQEIKDEENNSTSSVINPQGDESQNQEGKDGEDNVRPGKASTVQGAFEVKERSGAVAGASAAMPESLSTGELDGTKYAHVMILAEAKKNGLQMGRSLRNLLYRPKYRK